MPKIKPRSRIHQRHFAIWPRGHAERNNNKSTPIRSSLVNRGSWGVVIHEYGLPMDTPLRGFNPVVDVCQEEMTLHALYEGLVHVDKESCGERSIIDIYLGCDLVFGWLTGETNCNTCFNLLMRVAYHLDRHDVTINQCSPDTHNLRWAQRMAQNGLKELSAADVLRSPKPTRKHATHTTGSVRNARRR